MGPGGEREPGDWTKSSRSCGMANCVEVRPWRKAARSGTDADCVEVAPVGMSWILPDTA